MLHLLRKIKQKLLAENRLGKYFLYALGEIVLVVIGILIAVQIDGARTLSKNKQSERKYLNNLLLDLQADSITYTEGWVIRYRDKMVGLDKAKEYYFHRTLEEDTISFISAIGKGGIGSVGGLRLRDKTFLDLINTGNMNLIRNTSVRNRLSEYYTEAEFAVSYLSNLRSSYSTRLNGFRPYNVQQPGALDQRDISLFFKGIVQSDMIELINQELTFGYAANDKYSELHEASLALRDSILVYLQDPDIW